MKLKKTRTKSYRKKSDALLKKEERLVKRAEQLAKQAYILVAQAEKRKISHYDVRDAIKKKQVEMKEIRKKFNALQKQRKALKKR